MGGNPPVLWVRSAQVACANVALCRVPPATLAGSLWLRSAQIACLTVRFVANRRLSTHSDRERTLFRFAKSDRGHTQLWVRFMSTFHRSPFLQLALSTSSPITGRAA